MKQSMGQPFHASASYLVKALAHGTAHGPLTSFKEIGYLTSIQPKRKQYGGSELLGTQNIQQRGRSTSH